MREAQAESADWVEHDLRKDGTVLTELADEPDRARQKPRFPTQRSRVPTRYDFLHSFEEVSLEALIKDLHEKVAGQEFSGEIIQIGGEGWTYLDSGEKNETNGPFDD